MNESIILSVLLQKLTFWGKGDMRHWILFAKEKQDDLSYDVTHENTRPFRSAYEVVCFFIH